MIIKVVKYINKNIKKIPIKSDLRHFNHFNKLRPYFNINIAGNIDIKSIINHIFNNKENDDENKTNLTKIFELENKSLQKWIYFINNEILTKGDEINNDDLANLGLIVFRYFYINYNYELINEQENHEDIKIKKSKICSLLKDLRINGGNGDKKRKPETDEPEEDNEINLDTHINKISEIIKVRIGVEPDSVKKYDLYLKTYTADIFKNCNLYKLILSNPLIPFLVNKKKRRRV